MVNKLSIIQKKVSNYYSDKVIRFGTTPAGVDWSDSESQQLRFEQLVKICNPSKRFSINDLGCGYGALYDFLRQRNFQFEYHGYDLSDE